MWTLSNNLLHFAKLVVFRDIVFENPEPSKVGSSSTFAIIMSMTLSVKHVTSRFQFNLLARLAKRGSVNFHLKFPRESPCVLKKMMRFKDLVQINEQGGYETTFVLIFFFSQCLFFWPLRLGRTYIKFLLWSFQNQENVAPEHSGQRNEQRAS